MDKEQISNYKQASHISSKVVEYAKTIIKKDVLLLEIADKIEARIFELGGKPAFPVNLSINDIAAHYTPSHNDETKASGLLKVDIGIHVNGCIADTALSIDLENTEENKKLIQASEKALQSALDTIKPNVEINKIGKAIKEAITSFGFSPIINLSGHALDQYDLHAGLTIPNYDNHNETFLKQGAYAIEPFATTGQGQVYEGKPSGIYQFIEKKAIRDSLARKIIQYIKNNYQTLPFCERWIVKEFGTRALISLSLLEREKILKQFPQLIEKSHKKVSQAELSVLITESEKVVLK